VIGIVAARLVERFGQPVALLAGEGTGQLRASVRAPRGFAVDRALAATSHLLERHGGHPAAGGFTVRPEAVAPLHEELNRLASAWLGPAGAGPLVEPEALLRLERIEPDFWRQLQRLEPFGPGHPAPVFWSRDCQVEEQRSLRGGHLQLLLSQGDCRRRAVGWRWPDADRRLRGPLDVAYRLRCDRWQGQERLQLELLAVRPSSGGEVVLRRSERSYRCRRLDTTLVIRNESGEEVCSPIGAEAGTTPELHPYVQSLMREAAVALGLSP
jgi:single-stranded-DNA-specific exonuclease